MPLSLASSVRRSAHWRTCPTLPAGPSSSSVVAVWMESTMRRDGEDARAASTIAPTSLSASRRTRSAAAEARRPSRDARRRTWAGDSSPDA